MDKKILNGPNLGYDNDKNKNSIEFLIFPSFKFNEFVSFIFVDSFFFLISSTSVIELIYG